MLPVEGCPPLPIDEANNSRFKKRWTEDEDARLRTAVETYGESYWSKVSDFVGTRKPYCCQQRWEQNLKQGVVKGRWSDDEDRQLVYLVSLGLQSWGKIAGRMPGRSPKQCRERWTNFLDPTIKHSAFTAEEDALLLRLQLELGNKWAQISRSLPGRTENAVKVRYNTLMRKINWAK